MTVRSGVAPPKRLLALLLGFFIVFRSGEADAETEGDDLSWNYPRVGPVEYVATGILGAASASVFLLGKGKTTPSWTGGILFDNAVRDALRVRSPSIRDAIRSASDITSVTSILITVGIDSLLVPTLRGKSPVAWQMLVVDAEAFALSGLVTSTTYFAVGRARPSYEDCQKNPNFDPLCRAGATTSFWSGHTAVAFTAAGLSCAHHANLHIYGGGLADALGCGGMITLASATATLRVMGDRHYATDILPGMLVGFGFGYGVPTLLHYARGREAGTAPLMVTPSPDGLGLAFSGGF